jgi:CheY-like chemotaxis protein
MNSYVDSRPSKTLRILVVEDDADSRELIVEVLATTGNHDFGIAANAEEAIRSLREGPYDVVVTDIGLPGISGLELVETATGEGLLTNTTVIVCSAHEELRPRALRYGACFVAKPIALDELCNPVSERLDARSGGGPKTTYGKGCQPRAACNR